MLKPAGEKNLDSAREVFAGGSSLGVNACAVAEEAGGEDAGIVQDDEFIAVEEFRQIVEGGVLEFAGEAIEEEHAGGIALSGRPLCDLGRRERIVEIVGAHEVSL